jgi:UDP-2,3-diacylglucosamine pyrophosphatase LpxH
MLRRRLGMAYWSLAGFLKRRVKNAVNYIGDFERAVARETKRRGVHGVVCGHIQHAKIRDIQGIRYHNCGDWVESNTALVERFDGHIELLHWSDHAARYAADGDVAAAMHQAG